LSVQLHQSSSNQDRSTSYRLLPRNFPRLASFSFATRWIPLLLSRMTFCNAKRREIRAILQKDRAANSRISEIVPRESSSFVDRSSAMNDTCLREETPGRDGAAQFSSIFSMTLARLAANEENWSRWSFSHPANFPCRSSSLCISHYVQRMGCRACRRRTHLRITHDVFLHARSCRRYVGAYRAEASVSTDDSPRYYCGKQIPPQLNSMRQFNAVGRAKRFARPLHSLR